MYYPTRTFWCVIKMMRHIHDLLNWVVFRNACCAVLRKKNVVLATERLKFIAKLVIFCRKFPEKISL